MPDPAAYEDCLEVCRMLLEAGADPTMKHIEDGSAPFMATDPTCERGITPVARRIAGMLDSAIRPAGHTIQTIIEEQG